MERIVKSFERTVGIFTVSHAGRDLQGPRCKRGRRGDLYIRSLLILKLSALPDLRKCLYERVLGT